MMYQECRAIKATGNAITPSPYPQISLSSVRVHAYDFATHRLWVGVYEALRGVSVCASFGEYGSDASIVNTGGKLREVVVKDCSRDGHTLDVAEGAEEGQYGRSGCLI